KDGEHQLYTRAGVFDLEETGWLVSPATGLRVAGWNAVEGVIDTNQPIQEIRVPIGETIPAVATTEAVLEGNLNAESDTGTVVAREIEVIDSLGVRHRVILEFTKVNAYDWEWRAFDEYGAALDVVDDTNNPLASVPMIRFTSTGEI